jgi:adenylate cyclase
MKKTKVVNFYIAVVIALLFILLYIANTTSIQRFNNNFIDMYFNIRGEVPASRDIVIIDIDENSLQKLGHWPWRRDKIAHIVDNLTAMGVGVIGFDMVFAEEDDASPSKVAKEYNLTLKNPIDYDEIFAKSIASSPSILGYVLNMEQNYTLTIPNVNAVFIEKNRPNTAYLPQAHGVTANIPILQEAAYSSGSFNMFPDADGVVRSVPLLYRYDGMIYPSLSLEILRIALGVSMVEVLYDTYGVEAIKVGDIRIPTDANGRLFVNFAGAKKSYHYISAWDIYHDNVKREEIEGKIALLGTSAAGLLDLRAMPFDMMIPGVEIHANVMDNMMQQNFLQKPSNIEGVNILMILFSTLIAGFIVSLFSPFLSLGLSLGFLGLFHVALYHMMFDEGMILNIIYPTLSIVTVILALFFSNFFHESRQKETILGKFAKKVSPAVAETLIKSGNVDFKANEREVSIFFSDIRSFTTISEGFDSPHALIDYLNDYMSPMSDIIIKNGGTIDKYIGDAIMAYWNAPLDVKNHADMAVSSAIEQLDALIPLNKKLREKGLAKIEIGIGIHTGDVVVGEMGSHDRSDYTIIGDTVNLGSRVEGLCKVYASEILITQDSKDRLKNSYKLREIDSVVVKGKEKAVTLYSVLGFGAFDAYEIERESRYQEALKYYKEAAYKEAKEAFMLLYEHYHDRLFLIYHDRCEHFLQKGVKLENGVYRHAKK